MSQKELDGGLLALMEIHCKDMRKQYGHLRIDKLAEDQPIPFPHRQMPTFFVLQIATKKELKIWFQLEKTLFDHYETPLDIPTYMGVRPRQMGKATEAGRLRTLLGLDLDAHRIHPVHDTPIRADLTIDWTAQLYARRTHRPSVGPGGHADDKDINIIGKSGLLLANSGLFLGLDPGMGRFSRMFTEEHKRRFDLWPRKVEEDDPPEVKHSTDYKRSKGWKRIPLQIPNQAKPSIVLLALLSRSA